MHALAAARGVAPGDYEKSIISFPARELLRRYDFKVEHYEVKEARRS